MSRKVQVSVCRLSGFVRADGWHAYVVSVARRAPPYRDDSPSVAQTTMAYYPSREAAFAEARVWARLSKQAVAPEVSRASRRAPTSRGCASS
jgi:hypothetical protein